MEEHRNALGHLCRICGERLKLIKRHRKSREQPPKDVRKYKADILVAFKVDVSNDQTDINPLLMCTNCYKVCMKKKRNTDYFHYTTPVQWNAHKRNNPQDCETCTRYRSSCFGGKQYCKRSEKEEAAMSGRLPFKLHIPNIFSNISNGPEICGNIPTTDNTDLISLYTCNMCKNLLSQPVMTPCQHHFCAECITKRFQLCHSTTSSCPNCDSRISFQSIQAVPNSFHITYNNFIQNETCSHDNDNRQSDTAHVCSSASDVTSTAYIDHAPGTEAESSIDTADLFTTARNEAPNMETESPIDTDDTFTSPAARHLVNLALDHTPSQTVKKNVLDAVGAWVNVLTKDETTLKLKSNPKAKKVIHCVNNNNFANNNSNKLYRLFLY